MFSAAHIPLLIVFISVGRRAPRQSSLSNLDIWLVAIAGRDGKISRQKFYYCVFIGSASPQLELFSILYMKLHTHARHRLVSGQARENRFGLLIGQHNASKFLVFV